jgi:hypothetical protein
MDSIFGSPKLNRKRLMVNQRRGITQQFPYDANIGYKSVANQSIVSWSSRGKGVQGESVNSQNNASKFIVNKNWKPV